MKIHYITLYIDDNSGFPDNFRLRFNLENRFINNFLSRMVRSLNLESSDSFNMIAISLSAEREMVIKNLSNKVLKANVILDLALYNSLDDIERYEYCLDLLWKGYVVCNEFRPIPVSDLLMLHEKLTEGHFKNEWIHKKKRIIPYDIEVVLKCYLTSESFVLKIFVNNISTRETINSGIVIKTLPDEIFFSKLFKDIEIEGDFLIITEYYGRPKFRFKLHDLAKGRIVFETFENGMEYTSDFISINKYLEDHFHS